MSLARRLRALNGQIAQAVQEADKNRVPKDGPTA